MHCPYAGVGAQLTNLALMVQMLSPTPCSPQFYTQPKTVTAKWDKYEDAMCASSPSKPAAAAKAGGAREKLPGLDRVGAS